MSVVSSGRRIICAIYRVSYGRSRSLILVAIERDFLLVINSNLGHILHRFWDTATYWLKIANFYYPLSFSALDRKWPPSNCGKSFTGLETSLPRSWQWRSRDPSLHCFDRTAGCDGQTDWQTDAHRVGPGVCRCRIDPLRFRAGCRKRRPNQAFSFVLV